MSDKNNKQNKSQFKNELKQLKASQAADKMDPNQYQQKLKALKAKFGIEKRTVRKDVDTLQTAIYNEKSAGKLANFTPSDISSFIQSRVDDQLKNNKGDLLEKVNYIMEEKEKKLLQILKRVPEDQKGPLLPQQVPKYSVSAIVFTNKVVDQILNQTGLKELLVNNMHYAEDSQAYKLLRKEIAVMLAADDFITGLKTLGTSLFQTFAPDVIDWVKDKVGNYFNNKVAALTNGDSEKHSDSTVAMLQANSQNSKSKNVPQSYLEPSPENQLQVISSYAPGMTSNYIQKVGMDRLAGTVQQSKGSGHYQSICNRAIANLLCPEFYMERLPGYIASQKTALGGSVFNFNVTTNAAGNAGIWIFPDSICAGNSASNHFMVVLNDLTFNPVTGTQTPTPTYVTGPVFALSVNGNVNAVQQFRSSGFSVQLTPILSGIANQGEVFLVHTPYQYNPTQQGTTPTETLANLPSYPYYQLSDLKQSLRQAAVYTDDFQNFMQSTQNADYDSYYYILVTGAPGSVTTHTIQITYTFEFSSSATFHPIVPQISPPQGPATLAAYSNLIASNPTISNFNLDQAKKLADQVMAAPTTHDKFLDYLQTRIMVSQPAQGRSVYTGDMIEY